MSENQLANLLSLVGTLLDQVAHLSKKMALKKLVEVFERASFFVCDSICDHFAEDKSIGESAVNGLQSAQQDEHVGVEGDRFGDRVEQIGNETVQVLLQHFDEVEGKGVRKTIDFVEKGVYKVIFDFELGKFGRKVLAIHAGTCGFALHKLLYFIVQNVIN